MPLLVYKISNYEHTAEREQFRILCKQLKAAYAKSNEICLFIANYNIYDCELDGVLIKQDAIIAVEFKNYGGTITAVENGDWKLQDGTVIKGGSRKSVYQQAKLNHVAIKRGFADGNIINRSCLKNVATLVVFNQDIMLINKLSNKTKSWLHITDNSHFYEKVEDITSQYTDLSRSDFLRLIDKLNLDEDFLCKNYSNADFLKEGFLSPCSVIGNDTTSEIKTGQSIAERTDSHTRLKPEEDEQTELKHHVISIVNMLTTSSVKTTVSLSHEVYNTFEKYGLRLTHKYVVIVEDELNAIDVNKLSKIIHKNITTLAHQFYIWEEGEEISYLNVPLNQIASDSSHKQHIPRKTSTILPKWLDNSLFLNLRAKYAPEHNRYEYNLDLNKDEVLIYLGTYFPRSYSEVFCITDNLLANTQVRDLWSTKDKLNIFDFGCGTGGEIFGLLMAIDKYISPGIEVSIDAIDGNMHSLDALKNIFKEYKKRTKRKVELKIYSERAFSYDTKLSLPSKEYDFIMCNKMICELISHNIVSNAYYKITQQLSTILSVKGLLLILDITTKDSSSNYYYPQLMSLQMNGFVSDYPAFATLLPLSCANNRNCKNLCFMQQTFSISHSQKTDDKSRVCYRIIGFRMFVESFNLNQITKSKFVVTNSQNQNHNNYCNMSSGDTVIDAFNL